jgi:putative oxidoreductase
VDIVLAIGLALFGYLFVTSGIGHIVNRHAMSGYAQFKRVPSPMTAVLASGVLLIVAPVLVIIGALAAPAVAYVGLALLGLFLLSTLIFMHNYWAVDEESKMTEQINFNKNLALLGAVIALAVLI